MANGNTLANEPQEQQQQTVGAVETAPQPQTGVGRRLLGLVGPLLSAIGIALDSEGFAQGRALAERNRALQIAEEERQRKARLEENEEMRRQKKFELEQQEAEIRLKNLRKQADVLNAQIDIKLLELDDLKNRLPDELALKNLQRQNAMAEELGKFGQELGRLLKDEANDEAIFKMKKQLEAQNPNMVVFPRVNPDGSVSFFGRDIDARFPKDAKPIDVFGLKIDIANRRVGDVLPLILHAFQQEATRTRLSVASTQAQVALERLQQNAQKAEQTAALRQISDLMRAAISIEKDINQVGTQLAKMIASEEELSPSSALELVTNFILSGEVKTGKTESEARKVLRENLNRLLARRAQIMQQIEALQASLPGNLGAGGNEEATTSPGASLSPEANKILGSLSLSPQGGQQSRQPAVSGRRINVISPQGQLVSIPESQLNLALSQGFRLPQ